MARGRDGVEVERKGLDETLGVERTSLVNWISVSNHDLSLLLTKSESYWTNRRLFSTWQGRMTDEEERERGFCLHNFVDQEDRKKGQINREIAQRDIELDGEELGGNSKARIEDFEKWGKGTERNWVRTKKTKELGYCILGIRKVWGLERKERRMRRNRKKGTQSGTEMGEREKNT